MENLLEARIDTEKIFAFSGSLRAASCNQKLVKITAEGARGAGAEGAGFRKMFAGGFEVR